MPLRYGPFGMVSLWVCPFVDWPFRDGLFMKSNRLITNLINYLITNSNFVITKTKAH